MEGVISVLLQRTGSPALFSMPERSAITKIEYHKVRVGPLCPTYNFTLKVGSDTANLEVWRKLANHGDTNSLHHLSK